MGEGRRALFEGGLLDILASGAGAYLGEGTHKSMGAYSRKHRSQDYVPVN